MYACAVLSITVVSMLATGAKANPVEVFGFGSHHAAKVGAVSATVDDFASGLYNPAGLGFGTSKHITFGTQGAVSNLKVGDQRASISEPIGFLLGVSTPAPLGGVLENRLHIGFGLYLLPNTMTRVIARLPSEAFYPYYDNRVQRAVVLPSLAVRVREDLSVGIAVNYLATLAGNIQASEGATRAIEARVDEKIPSVARVNAGVQWRPKNLHDISLAAGFRQRFEIPFTTDAQISVAGEPINVAIEASGVFTPTQFFGGIAWSPGNASIDADVTWSNWSAYPGPFVEVRSALPLVGPLAGELPDVPYSDTISLRIGGEVLLPTGPGGAGWTLRGGYGFETSPFPADQSGVTNLLDGFKHFVGAGAGITIPNAIGERTLRIDAHVQAHLLGARTLEKQLLVDGEEYDSFTSLRDEVADDPADPTTSGVQVSNVGYPSLDSGGQVFSAGVSMEVGF